MEGLKNVLLVCLRMISDNCSEQKKKCHGYVNYRNNRNCCFNNWSNALYEQQKSYVEEKISAKEV